MFRCLGWLAIEQSRGSFLVSSSFPLVEQVLLQHGESPTTILDLHVLQFNSYQGSKLAILPNPTLSIQGRHQETDPAFEERFKLAKRIWTLP